MPPTVPTDHGFSSAPDNLIPQSVGTNDGKVKRTRRRQRLSCVECTKRRQKCDRQFPCGLCTSRGIAHLCRWEPIVTRPAPQRPPAAALQAAADANATIEALQARVAVLEKALQSRELDNSIADKPEDNNLPDSTSGVPFALDLTSSSNTTQKEASSIEGSSRVIEYNVQVAAVALAKLSLAPRAEYVGSGTVVSALRKFRDPEQWRYPIPCALSITCRMPPLSKPGTPHPVTLSIRRLISQLPSRDQMDTLLRSFFAVKHGEFALPELWTRTVCQQMWYHIDLQCIAECSLRNGCPACQEEINPHWLSLLFAILALAPASGRNAMQYANSSLTAKRIVDDILLSSPAYAATEGSVHGSVLSCLGAALLSAYFADRGRVSEAWKLCGNAIRNAQALGLHRDPRWRQWATMGPVDKDIRAGTWCALVIRDRLYSYILGRPPMTIKGSFETMPWPPNKFGDGASNNHALFQHHVMLLTDIICEATTTCLSCCNPIYSTVVDMDRKFQEWEGHLPRILCWRNPDLIPDLYSAKPRFDSGENSKEAMLFSPRFIPSQRVILAAWYLDTLMNIHRPYLVNPPLESRSVLVGSPSEKIKPPKEKCIELAIELASVLCHYQDEISTQPPAERVVPNMFSYFLFDSAVALVGALSQAPPHGRAFECIELLDKVMLALRDIADWAKDAVDGEGETAKRALKALTALRRTGKRECDDQKTASSSVANGHDSRDDGGGGHTLAATASSHSRDSSFPSGSRADTDRNLFHSPATSAPFPQHLESHAPHTIPSAFWVNPANSDYFGQTPRDYMDHAAANTNYQPLPGAIPYFQTMTRAQDLLNPYAILQDVQQSATEGLADFDMDWTRVVGTENWYASGSSGNAS